MGSTRVRRSVTLGERARRAWVYLFARGSKRDPLGGVGERAAARMLRKSGYRIIGRNVRVPMGEADIVCLAPDAQTMVVVEVKSRRVAEAGEAQPAPEASVHAHKREKLIAVTRHLARANRWEGKRVRIDVVGVECGAGRAPVVRHHVDAVRIGW